MTRKVFPTLLAMLIAWAAMIVPVALAETDNVPRMTADQLNGMLGNPDLIIVDVRFGWQAWGYMVKGAVREDPRDFYSWADKYPKDKTIVLY